MQAGGRRFDPVILHQAFLKSRYPSEEIWIAVFTAAGCWIFNNQEEVKVSGPGNGIGHWVVIAFFASACEPAAEARQA